MRLLKNTIFAMLVVLVLCIAAFVWPMTAMADTAQELPIEAEDAYDMAQETEESEPAFSFVEYFEREWLDKIVQCVCVFLGAISAILVALKKVRDAHKTLKKDGETMQKSQVDISKALADLGEIQSTYRQAVAALDATVAACRDMYGQVGDMRAEIGRSVQSMRQAMLVAYCADTDLVSKGVAKQIATLLEDSHESNV